MPDMEQCQTWNSGAAPTVKGGESKSERAEAVEAEEGGAGAQGVGRPSQRRREGPAVAWDSRLPAPWGRLLRKGRAILG
eukprot:2811937-Prymnesium_polylepis.1